MGAIKRHYLFYIAALYMLWAASGDFDFDYGFYQLLRFVAFFAFGFAAFAAFISKQQIMPFVLGFLAIVFNPFLPIYLERETWQFVDALSGILLIAWVAITFKDAVYAFFNKAIKKNKKASIAVLTLVAVVSLLILVGWPVVYKEEEPAAAAVSSDYPYPDPLAVEYEDPEQGAVTDNLSDIAPSDQEKDKQNFDLVVLNTTTTEGLSISEVQRINKRRKELGISVLQEKNKDEALLYGSDRPFKSEIINNMYQSSINEVDQGNGGSNLEEEGTEQIRASSEAI